MSQRRISLVCVSLRGGGTERIVSRIANHLSRKYPVSIVTLAHETPFFPLDERVDVVQPSARIGRKRGAVKLLFLLLYLFRVFRRTRPDLCLGFGEDIAAAVCVSSRLAGVPAVWAFFRGSPGRSLKGVNGVLNPLACRLASRIVLQTERARTLLSRRYRPERLMVWSNPIEIPDRARNMDERDKVIVSVGSIGRKKNQQALLNSYAALDNKSGWELVFIGDGPKRAGLEARAAAINSDAVVRFLGERRDVSDQLDKASIFAFTSLSEGFPNALAEAMASGCACISYDCTAGPSDLIEHGINGFLVPPGDETGFAQQLQKLVDDGEMRAEFSRRARQSTAKFESGRMMQRLEAALKRELNRGGREKCVC